MKVNYDMETMIPSGGFKQGEMMIFTGSTGKTIIGQLFDSTSPIKRKFLISDQAQVDGETWYTISCNYEVSDWLRTQPTEWRYEESTLSFWQKFDIHEKLYTMLALRWS